MEAEAHPTGRRKTPAWVYLVTWFVFAWIIMQVVLILFLVIHEGGHALACKAQGYHVLRFCPFCRPRPSTDCSNNYTPWSAAGGTLASITGWATVTTIFAAWLTWRRRRDLIPLLLASLAWVEWSYLCLGEVLNWALMAHSTRIPMPDTVNFSTSTEISPHTVIIGSVVQFTVMMAVSLLVVRKTIGLFLGLRTAADDSE